MRSYGLLLFTLSTIFLLKTRSTSYRAQYALSLRKKYNLSSDSVKANAPLFPNFNTAIAPVRQFLIERLEKESKINPDIITFMNLLDKVEENLFNYSTEHDSICHPRMVVVEGLDGSGKSSLASHLVDYFDFKAAGCYESALRTPTKSMEKMRKIFDDKDSAVTRAFYMLSNYILVYEMYQICKERQSSVLFVVDRFYSSTCAYTVGDNKIYNNVSNVDQSVFAWPDDLLRPDVVLVLKVSQALRNERIEKRERVKDGEKQYSNKWDKCLLENPDLAGRIYGAYQRIEVDTVVINADGTLEEVLQAAISVAAQRNIVSPLASMLSFAGTLSLASTNGRRNHHAPWSMQIATNSLGCSESCYLKPPPPPSLRTVGIHFLEKSNGIVFISKGSPGGAFARVKSNSYGNFIDEHGNEYIYETAAFTWVGGDYPNEQQWRGEGIVKQISFEEFDACYPPVPSNLKKYMLKCGNHENESKNSRSARVHTLAVSSTAADDGEVTRSPDSLERHEGPVAYRLTPFRMEVLVGGPSSPIQPVRYEWNREPSSHLWGGRPINLYSMPSSIRSDSTCLDRKPLTIAFFGTHTSGKLSIGKRVARALGCQQFEGELGEILRNNKDQNCLEGFEVRGESECDDAGKTAIQAWDEKVNSKEVERDVSSSSQPIRVVETWHPGNLAWAILRVNENAQKEEQELKAREVQADEKGVNYVQSLEIIHQKKEKQIEKLVSRAIKNIRDEIDRGRDVLFVYLDISVDTMMRRRASSEYETSILPFANERECCRKIHSSIGFHSYKFASGIRFEDVNIPMIRIENNNNGEEGMQEATRTALEFIAYYRK